MKEEFNIEHYNYPLREEQIAKFPLEEREKSKLLIWRQGKIFHDTFENVPSRIPPNSLLVFNDTRVIAARLRFQKATGADIEIFLLHPELPTRDIAEAMTLRHFAVWSCLIGNKKKWKNGVLTCSCGNTTIRASFFERETNLVKFEWTCDETFSELINKVGETPLPPYLKRKPIKDDSTRYQTVYSRNDGAVAAPTAGLHFTKDILDQIRKKECALEYLTLHVSAGTFKPVEQRIDYRKHEMHREQIIVKKDSIANLYQRHANIIAVGTTSLRVLESLYWYGVMLSKDPDAAFFIPKNLPYELNTTSHISFEQALGNILDLLKNKQLPGLQGETEIFIYPGYKIRTACGLFTNFHLPKSTLLLLISAFTGPGWKKIYREALQYDYRFLSYGDSSLLFR